MVVAAECQDEFISYFTALYKHENK